MEISTVIIIMGNVIVKTTKMSNRSVKAFEQNSFIDPVLRFSARVTVKNIYLKNPLFNAEKKYEFVAVKFWVNSCLNLSTGTSTFNT